MMKSWPVSICVSILISLSLGANEPVFEDQERKAVWLETKSKIKDITNVKLSMQTSTDEARIYQNQLDLLNFKSLLLEKFEEASQFNTRLEETLSLAESRLKNNENHSEYLEDLVNPAWRNLVEQSFKLLFSRESYLDIPELWVGDDESLNDLQQISRELEKEIRGFAQKQLNSQAQEHQRLLLRAGVIRSQYFKALQDNGGSTFSVLNPENWEDIRREIIIIPYRWTAIFHTKALTLRQNLSSGAMGYVNLVKDLIALLLLLITPFLTWVLIKKFTDFIDKIRDNIVNARKYSANLKTMALWIQRINPFVPWLISLLAIDVANYILEGTTLVEFTLILPYFRYYVYYKIFRRSIVVALTSLSTQGKVQISREARLKITQSSKISGIFILTTMITLHSFESVVSEGIVYTFIRHFLTLLGIILLFTLAHKWREEISQTLNHLLSKSLGEKISGLPLNRLGILLSFPCFVLALVIIATNSLKKWGSEFDISKRVSAKFFRKKLESSEKLKDFDSHLLPDEYISKFQLNVPDDEYLLHKFKEADLNFIKTEINEWIEEKSEEHSLAIYGDSGVGKSTLLRLIELHYGNLRVIKTTIPPKLSNAGAVQRFFGELLGVNLEHGESSLVEADKKMEHTLVIVDEAHHMFLSQVGGFEAYRAFIEIINARTENIFWLASFNSFSWQYLNSVFGRNQYFRVVKKISNLSEGDIKEMIISRHNKTGYSLSYDDILEAARSVDDQLDTAYVENKFFRLLWEQSYGNPRRAIKLWFSALKKIRGQTLKVGLPALISLPILNELNDDAHFVYTAILRHDSLSTAEVVGATNLAEGVVRHAIKVGLENEFLERDKRGRFSVCTINQYNLIQFLKKKNFIYGN